MPRLNVGDVFSVYYYGFYKSGLKYWKVTKITKTSYLVIRCTKTGKEFTDYNGYSTSIDQYFDNPDSTYQIVKRGTTVGDKVDFTKTNQGILIGQAKRRIKFLQARVARDLIEIQRLDEQLNRKELQ